jgi:hypothetical protein
VLCCCRGLAGCVAVLLCVVDRSCLQGNCSCLLPHCSLTPWAAAPAHPSTNSTLLLPPLPQVDTEAIKAQLVESMGMQNALVWLFEGSREVASIVASGTAFFLTGNLAASWAGGLLSQALLSGEYSLVLWSHVGAALLLRHEPAASARLGRQCSRRCCQLAACHDCSSLLHCQAVRSLHQRLAGSRRMGWRLCPPLHSACCLCFACTVARAAT